MSTQIKTNLYWSIADQAVEGVITKARLEVTDSERRALVIFTYLQLFKGAPRPVITVTPVEPAEEEAEALS